MVNMNMGPLWMLHCAIEDLKEKFDLIRSNCSRCWCIMWTRGSITSEIVL